MILLILLVFWLLIPAVLFVAALVYGYVHRNDPLSYQEAVDQLRRNDCCACEMCASAHMKWGKR